MPIQFQEKTIHEGREGIATMTFQLISYENMSDISKEVHGDKLPMSFAEMMRSAKKDFIIFESDLYPRQVTVTYEQMINEYKGMDFENAFLSISTKFLVTPDTK